MRGFQGRSVHWLALGCTALLCACAGMRLQRSIERNTWLEVQAGPYRIVGDLPQGAMLALARRLLVFDRVTHQVTDARDVPPRVPTVVLALAHGQYAQLGMPDNTAGLFFGTARGNFVFLDARPQVGFAAESVLYHEYGHFVLHNSSPFSYPAWYDEGTAEMLRSTHIEEAVASFGDLLPERIATLRSGLMPSQELFEIRSPLALSAGRTELFYAQAWLTVLYLRYAGVLAERAGLPVRSQQVLRYLELYDRGVSVPEAFAQAFGIGFAELDRELEAFLQRGSTVIKYIRESDLGALPQLSLRALRPAETAEVLGSAALATGQAYRVAERLYSRALELEPQRPAAAFGLARSRLAQERGGGLDALFERARSLSPDDALGRVDYAEYLLWKASALQDHGASSPEAVGLARRAAALLEQATAREPQLPEARYQLARAYSAAGEDRERVGAALAEAYELLPSDTRIAYAVAHWLAEEQRFAAARRVATRALAGTHDPRAADDLESLLARWPAASGSSAH